MTAPTLADFLLARIAEEEGEARKAQPYEDEVWETAGWWSPTDVLAECKAKRAIIALHNPCDDWSYGDASTCPELAALRSIYGDQA